MLDAALLTGAGLTLANCAAPSGGPGGTYDAQQRREIGAFAQKKYGQASPRVVADGTPVPRGGGRFHVGKPYQIAGRRYVPTDAPRSGVVGQASWYGAAFHGRKTANGEIFDRNALSAAHPTMPLPSYARVTNLANGRSIIVRVNDRGPFHGGRIIDVSQRVAESLDFRHIGTARVKVDYVKQAGLAGSEDRRLLASLRTDGQPATLDGGGGLFPTAFAQAVEPAPRPSPVAAPVVTAQPAIPPQAPSPVVRVAALPAPPPAGVVVRNVPLPPDRPFDLVTIPGAGVPVADPAGSPKPPVTAPPRRQVAALTFFAPPEGRPARFAQAEAALARLPFHRFEGPTVLLARARAD